VNWAGDLSPSVIASTQAKHHLFVTAMDFFVASAFAL